MLFRSQAVDRKELAEDKRFRSRNSRRDNYADLHAELAAIFSTRTRDEWLKRLEENDVPAGPLYNMAEVLGDPQVKHLGLVEEIKHPKAGALKFVRSAVNYADLPRKRASAPPLLGEQTTAILTELGYSKAAIGDLERLGIVKIG